jgi:pantetheine-phosphate adenylyltransferase
MKRIALFPGSFDPITNGHVDIIRRAMPIFDEVVIGIGQNSAKTYLFELEQRKSWIEKVFRNDAKIKVEVYEGLTVRFSKSIGANYIVRGLRNAPDFEYEKSIAQFNKAMHGIDTVLFFTEPALSPISSTIIRDVIRNDGDVSLFVPVEVRITKKIQQQLNQL